MMMHRKGWLVGMIGMVLLLSMGLALAQVRLDDYHRRDRTSVKPHYRTAPDASSSKTNGCTTEICLENDRTDGVTPPPCPMDPETGECKVSPDIEATGYAYPASIDRTGPGNHLELRIESTVRDYRIQILRLGDYGGVGARIVGTLPGVFPRNDQPPCITESNPDLPPTGIPYPDVGLCRAVGHITDSCPSWTGHPWMHPSNLPSGIFLAHVVDAVDGKTLAVVPFTVRDDRRTSAVLVQVPDTTWAAYNTWGDTCNMPGIGAVYVGPPYAPQFTYGMGGRIRASRFDRPYADQFVFAEVAPYVRFFEHIGADVSYITARDVDADWARPQSASLLLHATGATRAFVITGHDEYWSQERRNDIERARRAGVHMMFLTANDIHWRTITNSVDELYVAKESNRDPGLGSQATWTGNWADPRYVRSTTGDATGPENATGGLVSGAFSRFGFYHYEVLVSADEGRHRFWRGTAYANGGTGSRGGANLNVVAGEWDKDVDNGFRPPGLAYLSSTPTVGNQINLGFTDMRARSNYTTQITHHMVLFRDPQSGALTFHAGTTDFGNALEEAATCDPDGDVHLAALQHGLVNLMADMGLPRPGRLPCPEWWTPPPPLPALPSATVAAPASPPMMGRSVELRGTAAASGGAVVAAVEVGSRRQGTTPTRFTVAAGRQNWVYDWTPPAPGTYEIAVRVADDRGQVATTSFITVSVPATTRLYDDSDTFDAFSTFNVGRWMGTQFRTSVAGTASQLRVWMPDSAAYSVVLVDMDAADLVTGAAGTTEAKAGWRGFTFATPVALQPNRNYAALAWVPPNSLYAYLVPELRSAAADAAPLRSPAAVNSRNADWSHLDPLTAGIPVDVVFDASAYWSTTSTARGWFATPPVATLKTSSVEQRIGFQWTPASDGYVDGLRLFRPAGDNHDYVVELLAAPAEFLVDGLVVMAAAPILHGSSAATFDIPVQVFRNHSYRAVVHVDVGGTFPRTAAAPTVAPWLSDVMPIAAVCNRDPEYTVCNPEISFTRASDFTAIDIAFRPTAAFRQSLWPRTGVTPMEPSTAEPAGTMRTMGTVWRSPSDGYVEGIRFYNSASEGVTVRLYDPTGCAPGAPQESCLRKCSATGTPEQEASGWYMLRFERPCQFARDHDYIASVYLPSGFRARTNQYFQNMDPTPGADTSHPWARNQYGDGFLVATKSVQSTGDVMPNTPPPNDDRTVYFVEPIVRDGR
jgi:hypothetical protein